MKELEQKIAGMEVRDRELENLKSDIENLRDRDTLPLIEKLRSGIEDVKRVKKEFAVKQDEFELKKNEIESKLGEAVKAFESLKKNPEDMLDILAGLLKKKKAGEEKSEKKKK